MQRSAAEIETEAPATSVGRMRLSEVKGYPNGLAGDAIAFETRIITAGDIFDAMTAGRPYRGPMPVADALGLMEQDRGTAIDGRCLDALRAVLPRLAVAA